MVDGDERLDVLLQQVVDHIIVKLHALGVQGELAIRHDTAPRDGHAEVRQPHLFSQVNIFLVTMIRIIRDIAILVGGDLPRDVGESIPNAHTTSILIVSALHLIGRRCCAVKEEKVRSMSTAGMHGISTYARIYIFL